MPNYECPIFQKIYNEINKDQQNNSSQKNTNIKFNSQSVESDMKLQK